MTVWRSIQGVLAILLISGVAETVATRAAAQSTTPVDLELAFVVDASGSIDETETRLQRQGYADALANPAVLDAIRGGYLQAIAVTYIEFAAGGCVRIGVPWTRLSDAASARAFGDHILALDQLFCPGGNAIGEAVNLATAAIQTNAFEGTRRVIDVSGDGPNTLGPPVEQARDAAVALGITINGLVIRRPEMPDLEAYYKTSIAGGRRSFVMMAESRRTFAQAILKKILQEIAENVGPAGAAPVPD